MGNATLHVSNLPFTATEAQVRELFAPHGQVQKVDLVVDRTTGRPSGFGFVTLDEASAPAAITAVNGATLLGRSLRVNGALQRQRLGGGPYRR